MRNNDDLHAANRLDQLWDEFAHGDSGSAQSRSASDASTQAMIGYLDLLAPSIDTPARERIRTRLFHESEEETPMTGQRKTAIRTDGGGLIAPIPARFPGNRRWAQRINHPFVQIAATLLLVVAFLASWVVFDRGNNGPVHRGSHMAALSSPSPDQGMPYGTGRAEGVLTVELDPAGTNRELVATIRRITLPPRSEWTFDTGQFGLQSNLVSHYLDAGSVIVAGPDTEIPISAGEDFTFGKLANSGPLTTIRTTGGDPAVLYQMIVHDARDASALPTPPQGASMQIMGTVPLQIPAMQRTRLLMTRSTLSGGTFRPAGDASRDILFTYVESGELRVTSGHSSNGAPVLISQINGGNATPTPADGATLHAGESVTTSSGVLPALDAVGDQPTTALLLTVAPISDSELANRGVSVEWTLTNPNLAVTLELRKITLAPGMQIAYPFSGVSLYWGISGTLDVSLDAQPAGSVTPGQFLEQSGTGSLVLKNLGSEPAVVIQAIAPEAGSETAPMTGMSSAAQIEQIARESFTLPTGNAAITMRIETPGDGSSNYLNQSAQLLAMLSGNATMQRIGGDVEIHLNSQTSAPGSQPAIGETVPLSQGDWISVAPGGAYQLSAGPGGDAQVLSLSIGMTKLDTAATPAATPASSGQGDVVQVAPGDCRVTPRTLDEFAAILSDPTAEGTPTTGKRDVASSGVPADQATIDGVLDTVKQVVACNTPGSHLSLYSLYSPNMLRFLALNSSLAMMDVMGMAAESPQADQRPVAGYVSIESVVIFPDGKAGAMANVNGEVAYITFVYHDGFWQIDFWDDRMGIGTPAP